MCGRRGAGRTGAERLLSTLHAAAHAPRGVVRNVWVAIRRPARKRGGRIERREEHARARTGVAAIRQDVQRARANRAPQQVVGHGSRVWALASSASRGPPAEVEAQVKPGVTPVEVVETLSGLVP